MGACILFLKLTRNFLTARCYLPKQLWVHTDVKQKNELSIYTKKNAFEQ